MGQILSSRECPIGCLSDEYILQTNAPTVDVHRTSSAPPSSSSSVVTTQKESAEVTVQPHRVSGDSKPLQGVTEYVVIAIVVLVVIVFIGGTAFCVVRRAKMANAVS